ncbi:hypothetical protein LOK49_LG12G02802 [Camellia lanceoleosa]|uniref:Uncharacterized protein n=1 Tax=Camellia lanceoleosa TaxID=1840588 RepID=A0ACC0FWF6_9ERIC|nr:hypothetical protein LOK49_LG12G02802 [Camellia lanceoleosa]
MEGSKDIQVVAATWFLDFCYLAQSFHSCQLSIQPRSLLTAAFSLAPFAAFPCISSSHGEAYFWCKPILLSGQEAESIECNRWAASMAECSETKLADVDLALAVK